jgi:acyl-CoA synthetase (AMP-forming)/AMP-acid ligase II
MDPAAFDNVAQLIDDVAAGDPTRAAVICDEVPLSFGELAGQVRAAAAAFGDLGVGAGDCVALTAFTEPATIGACLGACHRGAAAALLNPLLTPEEVTALRAAVDAVALIDRLEGIEDLIAGPDPGGDPAPGGDRPALTLFTSGTTGLPKPVPITHRALVDRLRFYAPGYVPDQPVGVRLMAAPLFHIGGLLGLLLSLWSGSTTVMMRRFDAGEWLELVERHHVESAFVVPTMLHRIIEHPDLERRDLSSLKALAYGAAAAPVDLIRRAMEAMPGVGFANTFGQTETLGGYTSLTPADHRDPARIGSVGRALPGVEIRIVAIGTDDDLPDGEVGELLVRSPQNVTAGWLRTGDQARRDAEGYLYPMGRLADTINRGGEKFGPVEVEAALRRHPGVAEAAVAGVPDPEMGERVGALVVLADGYDSVTTEELREHCRQHIAPFKVPERVVLVDRLPYDQLGKLRRPTIARIVAEQS